MTKRDNTVYILQTKEGHFLQQGTDGIHFPTTNTIEIAIERAVDFGKINLVKKSTMNSFKIVILLDNGGLHSRDKKKDEENAFDMVTMANGSWVLKNGIFEEPYNPTASTQCGDEKGSIQYISNMLRNYLRTHEEADTNAVINVFYF